jgi:hypothetical protein
MPIYIAWLHYVWKYCHITSIVTGSAKELQYLKSRKLVANSKSYNEKYSYY